MFIVKLMRYIRGYVIFVIRGVFVERFLNLCARAGIPIWGLMPQGEQWEARTVASDYKKLRPMTRTTGVRLRVKSRHGAPFVARRYRKRAGLLAGVLVFSPAPGGDERLHLDGGSARQRKAGQRRSAAKAEELGVRPGVYRRSLDARRWSAA
jgi:similar to stage IV sporulation protein